ncbi:PREDICTED: uncharacterized protein LOC104604867 [Nelumbo nucifera]|nr:PREDICTED: uncharacterized protein LOC104604867 [Nelumbo nucifera]
MDEYYLNSSMNKVLPSKGGTKSDDCAEESGWTVYFEDYFLSNNRETTTCSSVSVSSSLVSDAASCAAWKKYSSDQNGGVVGYSSEVGSEKSNKKLSFKKRRTRGALNDDDLEDTASSPVNRPKVCNMKQLGSNRRKKDYSLERF